MTRNDRLLGVALGLVIGVLAVVIFVFGGGASSIDSPSLDLPTQGLERNAEPPPGQGARR